MNVRLTQPTKDRKSVPLTERDLEDLARLRGSGPERTALASLIGSLPEGAVSDAMLLHAVFSAGLKAIREAVEEQGYAELAAQEAASGEAEEKRRWARRRRPSWADED